MGLSVGREIIMGTSESDVELVLSRNSGLRMGAEEKLAGSDWVGREFDWAAGVSDGYVGGVKSRVTHRREGVLSHWWPAWM